MLNISLCNAVLHDIKTADSVGGLTHITHEQGGLHTGLYGSGHPVRRGHCSAFAVSKNLSHPVDVALMLFKAMCHVALGKVSVRFTVPIEPVPV